MMRQKSGGTVGSSSFEDPEGFQSSVATGSSTNGHRSGVGMTARVGQRTSVRCGVGLPVS